MPAESPDDIISIITKIVNPFLKHLRSYRGEVKQIKKDGVLKIHSIDYGTYETDPESWVIALAGNWLGARIYPKKGDIVEFYFLDGTSDTPRWRSLDAVKLKQPVNANTIYENGTTYIKHFYETNKFEIVVTPAFAFTVDLPNTEFVIRFFLGTITFSPTDIQIAYLGNSVKISATGVDITGSSIMLNGKSWDLHIHPTTGLPPAPTAPPS